MRRQPALLVFFALIVAAGLALWAGGDLSVVRGDSESPAATAVSAGDLHAAVSDPGGYPPAYDWMALRRFYALRQYAPLWLEEDGLSRSAAVAAKAIAAAEQQGLPRSDYPLAPTPAPGASRHAKLAYEFALTSAILHYAHDMRLGRVRPESVYQDVSFPREAYDPVEDLFAAAERDELDTFLRDLEPAGDYGRLKQALAFYRAIAAKGGWPQVAAKDPQGVAARLAAENYLPSGAAADSAQLSAALSSYQQANGLAATGKLDGGTRAMLNISAETRAGQIAANMERLRWLPLNLGDRYILVNVAGASLVVMDGGQVALSSKVVVGAPDKPTPLLGTEAVAVTINPEWHVPDSIAQKEILPKLDSDPDYLSKKNMREEDGHIIQASGPDNALGTIKVEMPNLFDVYLHDTPGKSAFYSADRAQSHGCVRVEQIRQLAGLLLGKDPDEIDQLVGEDKTMRLPIQQQVPVYFLYQTAVAAPDGHILFRPDTYGRDDPLIAALQAPRVLRAVATTG
jgi:murein L,D-transpeptidase YcbB/YkuD